MEVYSLYNSPPHDGVGNFGPSKTRQSEAQACDINNIVKKYKASGVLPPVSDGGIYADVSKMTDYRAALEQVRSADEMFMKLPSEMRAEFSNDAAEFLDFVSNPENREKMVEMGLVKEQVVAAGEPPSGGDSDTAADAPSES